jgi:hypothetical protein
MWGFAFSLNPLSWRLGACDAVDDAYSPPRVVGRWYCLGPIAVTYDYE